MQPFQWHGNGPFGLIQMQDGWQAMLAVGNRHAWTICAT